MIPIKNSDSFSCERHNMWPEFVLCFFIIGRITWYISSMNSGWTSLCAVIRSARELPWMLSKLQRCYCEWSKSVPHRWKCFHLLILSYMLGLRILFQWRACLFRMCLDVYLEEEHVLVEHPRVQQHAEKWYIYLYQLRLSICRCV